MSIANLLIILINLLFSHSFPMKQPNKIYNRNISSPKLEVMVTHYDCSQQHITNMQLYNLNKIGECKIKPADFQILPAELSIFSQFRTLHAHIRHTCKKKIVATKSYLRESSDFITTIGTLTIWKDVSFTQKLKLL